MRIVTFISLLFLVCSAFAGEKESYKSLDEFHAAKAQWDAAVIKVQEGKSASLTESEAALNAMMTSWAKVPEELQKARYDELNRVWFRMAELSVKLGKYEPALTYLNNEMQYQYARDTKVFLSGQNRSFFLDVIKLEATVLGHLGSSYYPRLIDHFLMPVKLKENGLDDFVAMESTTEDEQNGISIPALPAGEDRKIIYLLVSDDKGNYSVKDSIQLIGKEGDKTRIVIAKNHDTPEVALGGITHRVDLKNGIPIKYIPLPTPYIKLKITDKGFEEVARK
jgi:hypothetical protein